MDLDSYHGVRNEPALCNRAIRAMRAARAPQRRRGFSLLELLVAIGIIAVLIGLLLPVAAGVRQAGRAAVCLANLQQWGDSFRMYVNANGGQCFAERRDLVGPTWFETLQPYNGDIHQTLLCPEATDPGNVIGSDSKAWGPERTFDQMPSKQSPVGKLRGEYVGSYGFNAWLYRIPPEVAPTPPGQLAPGASESDRIPVLADCIESWGHPEDTDDVPRDLHHPLPYYSGSGPVPWGPHGFLCYFCLDRHRRAVNAVFLDGHAERVPLGDLWKLKWNGGFKARDVVVP